MAEPASVCCVVARSASLRLPDGGPFVWRGSSRFPSLSGALPVSNPVMTAQTLLARKGAAAPAATVLVVMLAMAALCVPTSVAQSTCVKEATTTACSGIGGT